MVGDDANKFTRNGVFAFDGRIGRDGNNLKIGGGGMSLINGGIGRGYGGLSTLPVERICFVGKSGTVVVIIVDKDEGVDIDNDEGIVDM